MLNQSNVYFDDYFYHIDSQFIEINDSDYDSDTEETHKYLTPKQKWKAKIIFLHLGAKFKPRERFHAT